jgi:hypothetical protein
VAVLAAFASYAHWGPAAPAPAVEPNVAQSAPPSAAPGPRRSFTPRTAAGQVIPASVPGKVANADDNPVRVHGGAKAEPAAVADPATTGAIAAAKGPERHAGAAGADEVPQAKEPDKPRRAVENERRAEMPRRAETRQEPRRTRRIAKIASQRAAPLQPAERTKPQSAAKTPHEGRIAAAPVKAVSVCVYFVLCF